MFKIETLGRIYNIKKKTKKILIIYSLKNIKCFLFDFFFKFSCQLLRIRVACGYRTLYHSQCKISAFNFISSFIKNHIYESYVRFLQNLRIDLEY